MTLNKLIAYFETNELPEFPINYTEKSAWTGPNFVACHIKLAREGSPFAKEKLLELHDYLEARKKLNQM